jgi:hypothetical protein
VLYLLLRIVLVLRAVGVVACVALQSGCLGGGWVPIAVCAVVLWLQIT